MPTMLRLVLAAALAAGAIAVNVRAAQDDDFSRTPGPAAPPASPVADTR